MNNYLTQKKMSGDDTNSIFKAPLWKKIRAGGRADYATDTWLRYHFKRTHSESDVTCTTRQ